MTRTKTLTLLVVAVTIMIACGGSSDKKRAELLLDDAKSQMEAGNYASALLTIDSLRKTYPNDVDARQKALDLYQRVSLAQAQADLANTDSLMAIANDEYSELKARVERDRSLLRATYEETESLNLAKVKLDSLKVRFDMQCAKIKYIHKKQKE